MNRTADQLYFTHIAIIIMGCVIGVIAAALFNAIPLDFSSELAEAKRLGIVSKTILDGYPKSRDIVLYAFTMLPPFICSAVVWFFYFRDEKKRSTLSTMFTPEVPMSAKTGAWKLTLIFMAAVYIVFSFDVNNFYMPSFNRFVGAWPFMAEEGENLAWVQSILNGGVYGKDIHILYGPMMIYPLVWLMKIFGTTVVVSRVYTYGLNLLAYGIVLAFLYRTLRTKTVFIFAAAVYFLIYSPNEVPYAPNKTILRVTLGFAPVLLTYLYMEQKSRTKLVFAGIVLGQSVLFSQEVGICSAAATVAMLALMRRAGSGIRGFFMDIGCLAAGGLASILPMLAYFASQGALTAVYKNLLVHPRLVGLGYGALAFPDIREIFTNPWPDWAMVPYSVVFFYLASALYLVPLLILKRRDNGTVLKVSLLVFGAVLFRAALGRSDDYHVSFASQPLFMLIFLYLDGTLAGLKTFPSRAVSAVRKTVAVFILGAMFLLPGNSSYAVIWKNARQHIQKFPTILTVYLTGDPVPQVPRAGIMFDEATAESISKINEFLDQHTSPGDLVYFFPNEAAYYFLFNRNNPTRYAISYFAATREQRLELVSELEKNRPEYVIYSRNTWRIDNVPETIQVPEVCDYIARTYRLEADYGDMVVLKRNKS